MKGILIAFLLVSACVHAQEDVHNDLALEITMVKEKLLIGEPCFVNVTVKNTGDHDVTVRRGYLFRYKVQDADNKPIRVRDTTMLEDTEKMVLKPGEKFYHKADILWDSNTVGEYSISAEYEDVFDNLKINGNTVKVIVQEPEKVEDRETLKILREIRQENDNKEWYWIWYADETRMSKRKLFESHHKSAYWEYVCYTRLMKISTRDSLPEILEMLKDVKETSIRDLIDFEIAREYAVFGTDMEYSKQLTHILKTYPNSYVAHEAGRRKKDHDEYMKSQENQK